MRVTGRGGEMRKDLAVLAGLFAFVVTAGAAQAGTPFGQAARARAQSDASQELASARLPEKAREVQNDPSVDRALHRPRLACVNKYVVDRHGYWKTGGKPAAAWNWMGSHESKGSHWSSSGVVTKDGQPNVWYLIEQFRDHRGVTSRLLYVTIRAARGGGAAIRIDGMAAWKAHRHTDPCGVGSY
jgi:hypothetical protein